MMRTTDDDIGRIYIYMYSDDDNIMGHNGTHIDLQDILFYLRIGQRQDIFVN